MFYTFKVDSTISFIPVGWESSYPNGIPSESIIITSEQHQDYFTKNPRGFDIVDGKLIYTELDGPTEDEIRQQKNNDIDAEYQPQFTELVTALGIATLAKKTDLIVSLETDYAKLKAEYDAKRGEING